LNTEDYAVPEDLKFTDQHEWIRIEGEFCRIGITDYAQRSLHEIVFVDLPTIGEKVNKGESIGTVESIKAAADIYSPVSGEVIETNQRLEDNPELVNKDPYLEGWIALIKPSNLQDELKGLMSAEEYRAFLRTIAEK
jgi:glycine cleavage system H protein